jgi:DNA invertase Pin-like site-specific DNA recombinase
MFNIKAVIYARVSSREQEETGYSLSAQEKPLKEYAERRTFNFVLLLFKAYCLNLLRLY